MQKNGLHLKIMKKIIIYLTKNSLNRHLKLKKNILQCKYKLNYVLDEV